MKKYKLKKIFIKNIFSFIVFIILVFAIYSIIRLDILPTKYLILLLVVDIVIFLIGFLLYNLKKKVAIIFGIIFLIISVLVNSAFYYYFSKTIKYIDFNFDIKTYDVKTEYYLVTSKNNSINELKELSSDTNIDYYKYSRGVELAIKKLGKYNYKDTDEVHNVLERIVSDNSYFLLSKSDFEFVCEASQGFKEEDFKIINKFSITEKVPMNMETPDSYSIYISGLDYSGGRRDFNMIATINTNTHKIVLTSIPRDFYFEIPAYDNKKDSLTSLGAVDPKISREALEKLFNTKIDYDVNLYTTSLVKVVDAIGGVEFCSKTSFYTDHDMTLGSYEDKGKKAYIKKGCYNYNGLEALAIARERVNIPGGDRARIENCRQIFINIFKSLMSTTTLTNYGNILDSFEGLYTTNINKKTLTNLIKSFIDNPNYEIIEQSVDGVDGKGPNRYGVEGLWTLTPKMDTVNKASDKINEVLKEK